MRTTGHIVKRHSDIIGALSSGFCTVHCLITPLIFISKPLIYSDTSLAMHSHPLLWVYLDFFFLVLGFVAVYFSVRHTTLTWIKWALWLSFLVFSLGIILEVAGYQIGTWIMVAGSAGLVLFHLYNRRYCLLDQCN